MKITKNTIRRNANRLNDQIKSKAHRINTQCYIDFSNRYENSILLAGSGRSGTTWLSDIINYEQEYRYIFEPFSPATKTRKTNLDRIYIREDSNHSPHYNPVKNVLSGKVRSHWSDRFNSRRLTDKRLIKSIRANLFLKWLHLNFTEVPIVFLIRHPLSVAMSRMRYKHWKQESLEIYLKQEELIKDFLSPFKEELFKSEKAFKSTKYSFENHIFSWCIENYIPLKQFSQHELHIVFYENCCISPRNEAERLFKYLGETAKDHILEKFKMPSKLSREDSAILTGSNLISSWQEHLTEAQINRAMEILQLFGFDKIYSKALMPNTENLGLIMKPQ